MSVLGHRVPLDRHHIVFDVEAIGVFGEPFAVGWTFLSPEFLEIEAGLLSCDPKNALGTPEGREWVMANVPLDDFAAMSSEDDITQITVRDLETPTQLCQATIADWANAARRNGVALENVYLWPDVGWPVEHRFLERCSNVVPGYVGPYPVLDVAPVLFSIGYDPIEALERAQEHLPAHNPLRDARHSARYLLLALQSIRRVGFNLSQLQGEIDRLSALLNTPETDDFMRGVALEIAHQQERWSAEHDDGKDDAHWLWLIAYLATKALTNPVAPGEDAAQKQLHRIITVAAAAGNWHRHKRGSGRMRPGVGPDVAAAIEGT